MILEIPKFNWWCYLKHLAIIFSSGYRNQINLDKYFILMKNTAGAFFVFNFNKKVVTNLNLLRLTYENGRK